MKSKIRENITDREGENADAHHSDHSFSDDHRDDAASSGASTPRGDIPPTPFSLGSNGQVIDESKKTIFHKMLTSKAEEWIAKKGLTWPWRGNEREVSESMGALSEPPKLCGYQESDPIMKKSYSGDGNRAVNHEARTGSSSSINLNSTSSASSCGSTSNSIFNRIDMDTDVDCEIFWEDMTIGERIGQGKTVCHCH